MGIDLFDTGPHLLLTVEVISRASKPRPLTSHG